MNVHLHIERLIVDGLPAAPGQGANLRAGLEEELVRLLLSNGLAFGSSRAEASVNAGTIQVSGDASGRAVGRQIGQTLFASLRDSHSASGSEGTSSRPMLQSLPQKPTVAPRSPVSTFPGSG